MLLLFVKVCLLNVDFFYCFVALFLLSSCKNKVTCIMEIAEI